MSRLFALVILTVTTTLISAESASAVQISHGTADAICRRLGGLWVNHPTCAVCRTCSVCIKSPVGITRCHFIACDDKACDYVVVRRRPLGSWHLTPPAVRR
jgi:hypothetical protein